MDLTVLVTIASPSAQEQELDLLKIILAWYQQRSIMDIFSYLL